MAAEFDPYLNWLGIRETKRPINHYRLLGIELFESDANVIASAADRQMAHLRSFQAGPHGELVQRVLNEISAAKICLIKPDRKAAYDSQLRQAQAAAQPKPPAAVAVAPVQVSLPTAPLVQKSSPLASKPAKRGNSLVAWGILGVLVLLCGGLVVILIQNNQPKPNQVAQPENVAEGPSKNKKPKPADAELTSSKSTVPTKNAQPPAVNTKTKTAPVEQSLETKAPSKSPPVAPIPNLDNKPPAAISPPEFNSQRANEIKSLTNIIAVQGVTDATKSFGEEIALNEVPRDPPATPEVTQVAVAPPPVQPFTDKAAVAAKTKEIRDIFKEEYATRKPEERSAFARKLFTSSSEQNGDLLSQYVLLVEARDVAMNVGEADIAIKATRQLGSLTNESISEAMIATFAKLNTVPGKPPAYYQNLLSRAVEQIEDLQKAEDYDAALRLVNMAQTLARRLNDNAALNQLVAGARELTQMKTLFNKARLARETLKTDPNNAEANQTWGEFLCFAKNDFDTGIKLLAKGSDAELKDLAQRELSKPTQTEKIVDLGDDWWSLADKEKDRIKAGARARAVYHYEQVVKKLTGLAATKIEKRIKEGNAELSGSGRDQDSDLQRMLFVAPWTIVWKTSGVKDTLKFRQDGTIENPSFVFWEFSQGELLLKAAPTDPTKRQVRIKKVAGQIVAQFSETTGRTDLGVVTIGTP